MLKIEVPGQQTLEIENIVFDLDGTLTVDGRIHPKTKDRINLLARRTTIYVLDDDSRGQAQDVLKKVKAQIVRIEDVNVEDAKTAFVRKIGAEHTVAVGNGHSDRLMVHEASLGICVLSREGTSSETIQNADIVFSSILDALDFLSRPLRQKATLRR